MLQFDIYIQYLPIFPYQFVFWVAGIVYNTFLSTQKTITAAATNLVIEDEDQSEHYAKQMWNQTTNYCIEIEVGNIKNHYNQTSS